jgi:uncharacterized SAM-binding protein YcdF (DUF218 family)
VGTTLTHVDAELSPTRVEAGKPQRPRWRRIVAAAVVVILLTGAAITGRLFVVPASNRPGPADAFVVLGGDTYIDRLRAAATLVDAYPDAVLVVSTPGRNPCPRYFASSRQVICFRPDPSTTQGEARATAALAAEYGWKKITVVTTADQVWRARLRFSRCWSGDLQVVQAPTHLSTRLIEVPYELAATVKAEVFQRGC